MICSKTYHFTWIMHEQQITATTFILYTFRAADIYKRFITIELHSKCHLPTFRRQFNMFRLSLTAILMVY